MFSRQGKYLVPVLAWLGGMFLILQTPCRLQAQQPAQPWSTPDWYIAPAEVKQYFRLEYLKDKNALRSTNPGGDQVKQIKRLIHNYMSQLTQESKANLPRNVVERLLPDLHFASTTPGARQIAMDEINAIAPSLLTYPDDLVRYNVISILVQLSVKPGQIQNGVETPAVPYNPAYKILCTVVEDKKEFLGCRILAARGLIRICRDGENTPSSNEKSDIATALVKTLNATPSSTEDGIWWFRLRLIEALGVVDRIDNTATQPIVIEALLDVIVDTNEIWLNRTIAAQCITQLPYTASTNVPLITSEILNLLVQLSNEFNKAPTSPDLREPFKRIYLAFRPAQQRQAKDKKWGLLYEVERTGLSTHAPYVKGAWAVAAPLLKPFMEAASDTQAIAALPDANIQAITTWLKENPPSSRKVVPTGKDYPVRNAEIAAPMGTATK